MPPPNYFILPTDIFLKGQLDSLVVSNDLCVLLKNYRESYSWPQHLSSVESQMTCRKLEKDVHSYRKNLTLYSAHAIAVMVSEWAGNNKTSHGELLTQPDYEKSKILDSLILLSNPQTACRGLTRLCDVTGIGFVIASKIYRFYCPNEGAAVDRHTSYFFNSLNMYPVTQWQQDINFKREWSTGKKTASRIAAYTANNLNHNIDIYFNKYLPVLSNISRYLNNEDHQFHCAVSNMKTAWRPTDVEMAMYYYMASQKNLPR